MSGPEYPDAPPPEVPEEFAATYRDAYLRALESEDPFGPASAAQQPEPVPVVMTTPDPAAWEREPAAPWRTSRWFLPVLAAGSALMLVLAAYVVGKAVSGEDEPGFAQPAVSGPADPGESPDDPPRSADTPSPDPADAEAVTVDAVAADCTAAPSTDAAGRRVTYVPANTVDGEVETAWRCAGAAVGEKLILRIVGGAEVSQVGLIPGYAKTDPESGADRYAENNRITRVRWTLGDVSVVQRLDPDPSSRAMQLVDVPQTEADTVTVEILAVRRGPRNTTAISEIQLGRAG